LFTYGINRVLRLVVEPNFSNEIKRDCNVLIEEVIVAEEKVIFKLPKELN
jgi:hypothetical protein